MLAAAQIDESDNDGVESLVHVWYSAKLQSTRLTQLQSLVRSLLQEVCAKIVLKTAGTLLGKAWKFGAKIAHTTLSKEHWILLPAFLEVPTSLSRAIADKLRIAIMLEPEWKDCRDRSWLAQRPAHRACKQRLHEDGMLLPFARPREAFDTPQPVRCVVVANEPSSPSSIYLRCLIQTASAFCLDLKTSQCQPHQLKSATGPTQTTRRKHSANWVPDTERVMLQRLQSP
jgi:hypothetical protein